VRAALRRSGTKGGKNKKREDGRALNWGKFLRGGGKPRRKKRGTCHLQKHG